MPSAAVNRPVDPKQKEKDINAKLQLFGIYQAFKTGKLPSNKQCDIALNSALNSKALTSPPKDLSEEGQSLVKDLRQVIEEAKKLILSKNDGQLIQEFVWAAENISGDDVKPSEKPGAPVTKDAAKQDGEKALEGLKTLGTLLITNGEFRKLLNDALTLVRDIAGDASQKAADKVRPSQEALEKMDQPAEENTWHEAPDFKQHKDNLKSKFQKKKEAAQDEAQDVVQAADEADAAGQDGAAVAAEKAKQKKAETSSQLSKSSVKSKAKEYGDKTKDYLAEKMPKERREQAIWRMKKMVLEIQGRADYQKAIEALLSLVEKYGSTGRDVSKKSTDVVKDVRGGDKIGTLETNLRVLVERFANSTSLDDLFDSLEAIYKAADHDPELKGWFRNVNHLMRKSMQEQGYIMQDDCNRQWTQLGEHGRYLLRHRYKNHTNRILDEIKFLGEQFPKDPQNKAFGDSMEKLFTDLGRDSDGNVAFKKHLLKDIGNVILPGIFENVRYVPVPRIEVQDPMADVVVENIVIESDNLMPNVVEFGSDNYFRWGRKKISSKRDNKIMISVSGIQADLRDVSYYINKKQGFPSIKDKGVMDILLGGEGFGFKIAASTAQKNDKQHFVKLDKVTVKIDKLDLKLKKSSHKLLFKTFKPMLFRTVRPILQKVLEEQIRDAFNKGDAFAHELQQEVHKATEAAKQAADYDPKQAPSVYSRYLDAWRARMDEKKKAAEGVAKRDTKIQTAFTLHDSMFPDIKLPGGISTKATEYAELAKKGERWESPIFTIGNASESTDIPTQAAITRKPHTTTEAKLVDGGPGAATDGLANGAGAGPATNGTKGFTDEVDKAFGSNGPPAPSAANASAAAANVAQKEFNPQTA